MIRKNINMTPQIVGGGTGLGLQSGRVLQGRVEVEIDGGRGNLKF